ncbi:hypothetical protein TKK_0005531 [Trichogramma kaykai]
MRESLSLTLTGQSSILESQYFPVIELSKNKSYEIGLVSLLTFNSIPNISTFNNKLYVEDIEPIQIPSGSYEITDINQYLKKILLKKNISFELQVDANTSRSIIHCDKNIDFSPKDSIAHILGFKPQILEAGIQHISDSSISITGINSIRIECNIATGAYLNGEKVHTLHEFYPTVEYGYKIVEIPNSIIYMPVSTTYIDNIQLRIVDQNGRIVDFQGETITIRLHIRSLA